MTMYNYYNTPERKARRLDINKKWRDSNKEYNQQYYQSNIEKVKKQLHEKYNYLIRNEPWVLAYRRAKQRAKKMGWEFDLTKEYVESIWTDVCPVLGIPLYSNLSNNDYGTRKNNAKPHDNSPTLDRIDSSKGYVKGNIVVMSYRANMIKNCGTLEEHRKIANFLESQHISLKISS